MRKITQIRSAIALFIGISLLAPVVSIAVVDSGGVSMRRLLDRIAKGELRPQGFQRPVEPRYGVLKPRAIVELPFRISRGSGYGFVAVGDDNANDVDLQLLDNRNNVIIQDTDADDSAVVTFTPRRAGEYRVRVIMHGCQADECEYGLAVYKGSRDLKRRQ
ncbi:hypothetical protein C7B80_19185 [Cyanosarcina cf. burmensis CCALA 770]|nr:hypothetical protein C7B80_19185 [Cyanosarcina cf. burmensis CCALA 770]